MLEIKIIISAPELARAISNLASAMDGTKVIEQVTEAVNQAYAPKKYIQEPVVATQHTKEQIMQAGASLMDDGKTAELMNLLRSFGVQAVTQLKPEQLDGFAAALRDLGAKI